MLDNLAIRAYTRIVMGNNYSQTELSRQEISECAKCTAFNLKKATRAVQNLYDEAFKGVGLEGTQFTVLSHVFIFGPISITKLAESMHVDRTTVARNLNPLVKKGLIETKQGKDRRAKFINVTDEGKRVLIQALPVWRNTHKQIVASIGREKWADLISNLGDLVEKITES